MRAGIIAAGLIAIALLIGWAEAPGAVADVSPLPTPTIMSPLPTPVETTEPFISPIGTPPPTVIRLTGFAAK